MAKKNTHAARMSAIAVITRRNPGLANAVKQLLPAGAFTKSAATMGRKGGAVKSEAKTAACRANAKKPRPRKKRLTAK